LRIFRLILITDRQTDRQTDKQTNIQTVAITLPQFI